MITRFKNMFLKKPINYLGHLDILARSHNDRPYSAHKYSIGNTECIVGIHKNTGTNQFTIHLTKDFTSHEIGTFSIKDKTIHLKLPVTINTERGRVALQEIKRHLNELHLKKIILPYSKKFEKIAIAQGYKKEGDFFVLEI
jgi:hypothetical protein